MDKQLKKINRYLMIGWLAIVVVLTVTYFGELARGHRDWTYMSEFLTVTIIPAVVCLVLFIKQPDSPKLKYFAVAGYLLMYTFVLLNTNTIMTYGYIIPMLSLIVLYNSPKLVLIMGGVALAANIACVIRFFVIGMVESSDIKDVEIQLGMILFCFAFAYIASRIYNRIVAKNKEYIESIADKQSQLERVTLQTITTIANIIDAKDEYTKGHSYRVAEYSSALARELGYDKEHVSNVKYIGLLHDIGKIGIPDSILNKPGKLTDSEFALMRKHAEIGGNILSGNNMIEGLDEGAKYHHERYDGSGYPLGLKGDEIPEMARIIGIADAYDAMASNRVYRKRLPNEKIIAEFKRCSGTQFDPELAEVFISMIESGKLDNIAEDEDPDPERKSMAERSAELLQSVIGMKERHYDGEHDYLTGILNRSAGEKYISQFLSEDDGVLFIVDITNLLGVNKKHGIVAGDKVIKTTAETLSQHGGLVVSRYDGSGFLCFMRGIVDENSANELMAEICTKLSQVLRAAPEYEENLISIGGTLSCEAGRDLDTMLVDAEKALFYVKQLGCDGNYLYKKPEKTSARDAYALDLEQIVKLINNIGTEEEGGTDASDQAPDLAEKYELVREVYENNKGDTPIILITLTAAIGKTLTVTERDEAMEYLQSAIEITSEPSAIMFRFSSVQYMIMITGTSAKTTAEQLTDRIMNSFYKSYDKKNAALVTETAILPSIEVQISE